ncbi:P-loop containing nucleoside triphosphate hydrolase protein [Teratosphaeria nubilosa]|uniref:P-loop containing nucleoside triphosphate hydrolase protein n=1 Tax=Teratosphaeria nubilosa TaxID=161662 RepID=A0A6G1KV50_9PEZI|nr:P-loop containing nucleoside triphosphate hydrolase protein [Teratosphaeria nubilosa]
MDSCNHLLTPTIHVEVAIKPIASIPCSEQELRDLVKEFLVANNTTVSIGSDVGEYSHSLGQFIDRVEVADYTGPPDDFGYYRLDKTALDVQTYTLKPEHEPDPRRRIAQEFEESSQARIMPLPSIALKDEWDSLVFDDALPARLLRYLARMVSMMKQPGLNFSAFNWNRLCLLHGPPGSGKSTLCRALAQKLSIRLGDAFTQSTLVEINTNAMLSKYFGESGKLISTTFERVITMAQDKGAFVCVIMDEVETIAGSREKSTSGSECADGLRATNQLLTVLDRLRRMPNVIVLCTSNLIGSIDQAFLDRVDIKQMIPCPSPEAIYNIFRSCLNELVRSSLVDTATAQVSSQQGPTKVRSTTHRAVTRSSASNRSSSPSKVAPRQILTSPLQPEDENIIDGEAWDTINAWLKTPEEPDWTIVSSSEIPPFSEMQVRHIQQDSPARRLWALAQKCHGFSGRTLRRLPILGLAMYTWGGSVSLNDAVSALEAAVGQELLVKRDKSEVANLEA